MYTSPSCPSHSAPMSCGSLAEHGDVLAWGAGDVQDNSVSRQGCECLAADCAFAAQNVPNVMAQTLDNPFFREVPGRLEVKLELAMEQTDKLALIHL